MSFHILDFNYEKDERIINIFKKISEGNSILFLGAGASINDDKKFLSTDLIEFYEDKKKINWGISDITEFVDVLATKPEFSRFEFDNYVDECLRKYKVTEAHRIIASQPWAEIITTNFDQLIEKAYDEVQNTPSFSKSLRRVRSQGEFYYTAAADEVKYIKLNGCLSDKKLFPLVFSSDDFRNTNKYYLKVLSELRNPSDKINFLAAGYSFSDEFAKKMLDRIDSYGFRDRRIIYSIDAFVPETRFSYYESKKICIINTTVLNFFESLKKWEEETKSGYKAGGGLHFSTAHETSIHIQTRSAQRLKGNIVQLNDGFRSKHISNADYYKGEEPNYSTILRSYDVVKVEKQNQVLKSIQNIFEANNSRIIPLVFLEGSFGTGKSTFAYRLIRKLINKENLDHAVAFEIIEPSNLSTIDLNELFTKSDASIILLYMNSIEQNSLFKSLLDLRNRLSIDSNSAYEVIIICSVRENILARNRINQELKNVFSISIDCPLSKLESESLIEKLKDAGLVKYNDLTEKRHLVKEVVSNYHGDSFLSLLKLVSGNKHLEDLFDAYSQLSKTSQEAFIYTSLLYRYKIPMPAGLLRSLVAKDWEEFKKNVIEVETKGIIIQDDTISYGSNPDLYFRTKHPIIAEELIKMIFKNEDKIYERYKRVVTHSLTGTKSSELLINLLKALQFSGDYSQVRINNLYDLASVELSEEPHFLLHYAINLQNRKTIKDIKTAIEKIVYAEGLLEKRNHRLIHRRGVLNFELAKLYFNQESDALTKTVMHLNEARDLLSVKQILDPCSSFSYFDLISLEMWYLEKFKLGDEDVLKTKIIIEELFDTADRVVFEFIEKIIRLKAKYIEIYRMNLGDTDYLEYLDKFLEVPENRPYALVLKFNFLQEKLRINECEEMLEEMEYFSDYKDVLRTLFKYYGRNLHRMDLRMKFFNLLKNHAELEEMDALRYNYYSYVAESYNRNFEYAFQCLSRIKEKYHFLNPDYHLVWIDSDTNKPQVFEAKARINSKGKLVLYVVELNKTFYPIDFRGKLVKDNTYKVRLHFYLYGTRVEIVRH